jgi:hypothetical protein
MWFSVDLNKQKKKNKPSGCQVFFHLNLVVNSIDTKQKMNKMKEMASGCQVFLIMESCKGKFTNDINF